MKLSLSPWSLLAPTLLLCACSGAAPPPADSPGAPPATGGTTGPGAVGATASPGTSAPSTSIDVPIQAKSGSQLSGKATFTEIAGGVKVTVQVSGAPPGQIATHVHENGDCSAPDGSSAGGHFNPASKPHGLPPGTERHLGDLGNIDIKPDGTGSTELVVNGANLRAGDANSFAGRAIIVHDKKDDGGQPVGNAGGRIGCGVIRVSR